MTDNDKLDKHKHQPGEESGSHRYIRFGKALWLGVGRPTQRKV